MARKPEAPSPEKPPKRKMTQAEQSERFIETARQLGVGEDESAFNRAFERIVRGKQSPTKKADA